MASEEKCGPSTNSAVRMDGGCRAWMVVAGSFTIQALNWGAVFTFGILVPSLVEQFDTGRAVIGGIGSLVISVAWISGPVTSVIVNRVGYRAAAMFGSFLLSTGFLLSSFAPNVVMLCFAYSVLAGFGTSLSYVPAICSVNVYFERRRVLANGIAVCGVAVGTTGFAPIVEFLLERYGWRGTLLIEAGLVLNCCLAAVLCIPASTVSTATISSTQEAPAEDDTGLSVKRPKRKCARYFDWTLLINIPFIVFALFSFFSCMSFATPYVYLPDLGLVQVGLDAAEAATLILIIGIANALARIVSGLVADLLCVRRLAVFSVTHILCGLATTFVAYYDSFYLLAVYAVVFGAANGVISCLVPVILVDLFGVERLVDAFGATILCQGVGVAVGTPLAGLLFDYRKSYNDAFIFAGLPMTFSGILVILLPWIRRHCSDRRPRLSASSLASRHIDGT